MTDNTFYLPEPKFPDIFEEIIFVTYEPDGGQNVDNGTIYFLDKKLGILLWVDTREPNKIIALKQVYFHGGKIHLFPLSTASTFVKKILADAYIKICDGYYFDAEFIANLKLIYEDRINDKYSTGYKIQTMIDHGRERITTKEQLEKYPIGSLISYMTNSGTFKAGGFIIGYADEYFTYVTPDYQSKRRVRYHNVKTMWAGDVYKVRGDLVSITETKEEPTEYPVKIGDVVVHYADRPYHCAYTETERFRRMYRWWIWFGTEKQEDSRSAKDSALDDDEACCADEAGEARCCADEACCVNEADGAPN